MNPPILQAKGQPATPAAIRRFRLREYGLRERVLRHYVRFNSTKAQ